MTDLQVLFWGQVAKTPTCWLWLGPLASGGYGKVRWGGQSFRAHRLAWWFTFGQWPERHLHHICQERLCVRPDHLEALSPLEHRRRHQTLTEIADGH